MRSLGRLRGGAPRLGGWRGSSEHELQQRATFVDGAKKIRWVRDRGLDHAIDKEKHLIPFLSLKDLLVDPIDPPSSSCTLSSIRENRHLLRLPFRPIDFVRLFPSAFTEDPGPDPVIRPTQELLRLHREELSLYSADDDAAERLLRLLMLSRSRTLPLDLLRRLRLDLGLPRDFPASFLPRYPHYFRLAAASSHLDLVCWDSRLAVSTFRRAAPDSSSSAFPLRYPSDLAMDRKIVRWMEEWQSLPYLSPYEEDGTRLDIKSPLGEKWAVGLLHELLHLLVPKKTGRDELVLLAELAGLPAVACRKLLANYPGVFYVSNRNDTHTVILREAYKRDVLAQKHPLMEMRYKYIYLMHKPVEDHTSASGKLKRKSNKSMIADSSLQDNSICQEDGEDDEEEDSDEEVDEEEDSDDDEEDEEEDSDDDEEDDETQEGDEELTTGLRVDEYVRATRERTVNATSSQFSSTVQHLKTRKVFQNRSKKLWKSPNGGRSIPRSQASPVHSKARTSSMPNANGTSSQFSSTVQCLKTRKVFQDRSKKQWKSPSGGKPIPRSPARPVHSKNHDSPKNAESMYIFLEIEAAMQGMMERSQLTEDACFPYAHIFHTLILWELGRSSIYYPSDLSDLG